MSSKTRSQQSPYTNHCGIVLIRFRFVEYFLPSHHQFKPFPLARFQTLLASKDQKSPPEAQLPWCYCFDAWFDDGDGRIDLKLKDPAWRVELLRHGDRLSESVIVSYPRAAIISGLRRAFPKTGSFYIVDIPPQRYRMILGLSSVLILDCNNRLWCLDFL